MKKENMLKTVLFNYFLDLRKKEINKRERAELLQIYLEQNNMSQRALASELGIPHSTIQDWLMINRIDKTEYDKYIEDGMTETEIYRMLRNNKQSKVKNLDILMFKESIKKSISHYRILINYGNTIDTELSDDIKELVNILQRVLIHEERQL